MMMTLFSELGVSSDMAAPSADLVAFGYLQFSQIRGRQPYSIVRRFRTSSARVVQKIEGKQRNQPHKGDETPALRVDVFYESLEESAGLGPQPKQNERHIIAIM
jgi:hypothetical protein